MIKNKNSKTAKLDRELFQRIGKGELLITGNAINFMLYTINFVAKDGRIYRESYQIRERLKIQHKTFNRVVKELKKMNLLIEKDGFFYSRFHVLSNGEKNDKGYVKNIDVLNSDELFSLNIKKKRFFLYVASFSIVGLTKLVSVEALYSNKYHSGVNYIESYQELSEILVEFVQKGYFDVFVNGEKHDKNSVNFESVFHNHCGYDQAHGKQRMSKVKKNIIGIGISTAVANKVKANESSREEFVYYANENHIYHELMRSETIPFFISIQNELFNKFGEVGINLYRHALITYFSTEQENVLYHDLMSNEKETKAANTLMDFYLLKHVQDVIIDVVSGNRINKSARYFANEDRLSELILYFIQKSSDNQKILFDAELEVHDIQLSDLIKTTSNDEKLNSWSLLENHISDIYNQVEINNDTESSSHKRVIREWAERGILAKKEWIQQVVEKLKAKTVPFIRRERIVANLTSDLMNTDIKNSEHKYKSRRAEMSKKMLAMQLDGIEEKRENIDNMVLNF